MVKSEGNVWRNLLMPLTSTAAGAQQPLSSCRPRWSRAGLLVTQMHHIKCSPPAKWQNPSPPLHLTTDKLKLSVVTPNQVVGQSAGVHNQSNNDLFGKWKSAFVSMATRSHQRAELQYKISFTLSARSSTSFVRFVAKKTYINLGHPTCHCAVLCFCQEGKKTSGMTGKERQSMMDDP